MADTEGTRRRRGGAHFAEPGHASNINWGFSDEDAAAPASPARYTAPQGPSWDQDEASYTAAFELDDLLDGPSPRDIPEQATGSFQRIAPGQGARVTTRDTAAEDVYRTGVHPRISSERRPHIESHSHGFSIPRIVGTVVVALAVVGAALFLLRGVLFGDASSSSTEPPADHVAVGDVLSFDGYDYCVSESDNGGYVFERITGEEPLTLANLTGTPIDLLFYNGTFYIPENLDGTWDVMCYTMGDGSIATPYMDENGDPITGEGSLESAKIDGSELVLTSDSGEVTKLALV